MRTGAMTAAILATLVAAPPVRPQDGADRERAGTDFFEKRIHPVLVERCYTCHSAQARKLKGNLLLDTRAGVLKGGDLGASIVPGDPDKSLLVKAVRYTDNDLKMPPKKPLKPEEIADFEAWVKMGAPDPRGADAAAPAKPKIDFARARGLWPFRPVEDPPLPAVSRTDWPANAVDRFVLAALEKRGLAPVADADRVTLLRRVTFDLTGLPPTPEEMGAFLDDRSTGAYARAVDRLLASPRYGERWGRHWMDVIRYADTAGDNSDYPIPQMHRYRDYIIKAFNEDKPFDLFIREQVAGDLLPAKDEARRREHLIATGYLANAKRFGSRVDDYPWHLTVEDTIENVGRAFLGLSTGCARCHDHKFDPISQDDYYALYGIFQSTRYPWPGIELLKIQKDFVPLVPADQVEAMTKPVREKAAALAAEAKRVEAEKKRIDAQADAAVGTDDEADAKAAAAAAKKALDKAKKEIETHGKKPLPYETAYAVAEAKKTGNAKVQMKGIPERTAHEVPRRFLEVMGGQRVPDGLQGSGRLQLAEWLSDPANPLTARVLVNRLWLHHFGRGIVPTPNDFGKQGKPPTHPELLDWLARRFIESGWSIKAMHRLLVHSRAYRLSTRSHAGNEKSDPSNDWLWRAHRRRLDAESIRDALLAVSGTLDLSPAGPHPFPAMAAWDFTQHKPFKAVYDHNRRSVFLMTQRVMKHPFLGIFDGADTNASAALRMNTTTTLQALYFLNDAFFHEKAAAFATRVRAERPDDDARIDRAYRLAYGRPPSASERAAGRDYLGKMGWESYARVLLRASEFIYVN